VSTGVLVDAHFIWMSL